MYVYVCEMWIWMAKLRFFSRLGIKYPSKTVAETEIGCCLCAYDVPFCCWFRTLKNAKQCMKYNWKLWGWWFLKFTFWYFVINWCENKRSYAHIIFKWDSKKSAILCSISFYPSLLFILFIRNGLKSSVLGVRCYLNLQFVMNERVCLVHIFRSTQSTNPQYSKTTILHTITIEWNIHRQ